MKLDKIGGSIGSACWTVFWIFFPNKSSINTVGFLTNDLKLKPSHMKNKQTITNHGTSRIIVRGKKKERKISAVFQLKKFKMKE